MENETKSKNAEAAHSYTYKMKPHMIERVRSDGKASQIIEIPKDINGHYISEEAAIMLLEKHPIEVYEGGKKTYRGKDLTVIPGNVVPLEKKKSMWPFSSKSKLEKEYCKLDFEVLKHVKNGKGVVVGYVIKDEFFVPNRFYARGTCQATKLNPEDCHKLLMEENVKKDDVNAYLAGTKLSENPVEIGFPPEAAGYKLVIINGVKLSQGVERSQNVEQSQEMERNRRMAV